MDTTFPTPPPVPLARPWPLARLGPTAAFVALTLLGLALIGAALLGAGTSPNAPAAPRNGLVAFDSNGDIMVADPDDDYRVRQLTQTAAVETSPQWSPDSTRLLYWSRSGDVSSVGIMDATGKVLREITTPAGLELPVGGEPRWAPQGWSFAVVAGPDFSATVLIDPETGDAQELSIPVGLPSWSPDGSLMAWGAEGDQPPGLYVAAGADASGDMLVSQGGLPALGPQFTPAGDRIVYVERSPDGIDGDVVSVGVDGREHRTIVGGATNDMSLAVSPDGTQVAFIRSTAGDVTDCCGSNLADVYVIDIDGTGEPRRVGTDVGDWGGLTWSPDGTRLVTFNLASDQLVVMSLDPAISPIEIPTPGNVGTFGWQAIR